MKGIVLTVAIAATGSAGVAGMPSVMPPEGDLIRRTHEIPKLLSTGRLTPGQIPNPHWRGDGCPACHAGDPDSGAPWLSNQDINRLCNTCHESLSAQMYIHAVGMVPSKEKQDRMPGPFREAVKRGGGEVTCIACHDLPMQCRKERWSERRENPLFFREGPYARRTELCIRCHDPRHYARLNAHDQVTDDGALRTDVCLLCHSVTPKRDEVRSIDDVTFKVTDDLTALCTGCHPWRPHPGGEFAAYDKKSLNHLVIPSAGIRKQIGLTEKENDVILPLEPGSGRIFCATCHNPHERGVQRMSRADRGADSPQRLRLSNICSGCHVK